MHEYGSRFKSQRSDFGSSISDTPAVLSAVMPYLLFGEDSPRHSQWREGKQLRGPNRVFPDAGQWYGLGAKNPG
jgi:hypothetical protein